MAYNGPVIDVDVHHGPSDWSVVSEYLPEVWRSYLPFYPPGSGIGAMNEHDSRRADSFPEDGSYPGTSYELTSRQLLDPHHYHRCVLTHDVGPYAAHLNHYFMRDVCRAVNDWNLDTWLSIDDARLCSLIVVPTGMPEDAAAEIRRVAGNEKMVGVLLAANPLGRPLGDPVYHPIYEAAAESELPVIIHPGIDRPNVTIHHVGGPSTTVISFGAQISQQAHHYIASFLVHGVFEKYPRLNVLVEEYGIAWLPWLLWRLDAEFERLRRESPWVKRWPSEYVRDHIKLSTQPLEDVNAVGDLADHLKVMDGIENLLCFSTDYPHNTMDDPKYAARVFPTSWHEKVFVTNACDLFGWSAVDALSKTASVGA